MSIAFAESKPIASVQGAQKRLTELDGLRALAILPVIFHHCYPDNWGWMSAIGRSGWLGVDLFFVLSGYLISGILMDTVESPHYYRNFIYRRALRIFPLYYGCLAAFTMATRFGSRWAEMQHWGGVGWFVVYLGNIRTAWVGDLPPVFSFQPLWSLQVEEQFYLLYPGVVLFLSRASLRRILILCVFVAPVFRLLLVLYVPASQMGAYVLTPCRMDALAMGGLVAIMKRSRESQPNLARVRLLGLVCGALVAALLAVGHPLATKLSYSAAGMASACILCTVMFRPERKFAAVLRWKPFVYTGQIAYGLYLLHAPASWAARSIVGRFTGTRIDGHSALSVPITFAAAFVVAGISWRFFEAPILRFKDRVTR